MFAKALGVLIAAAIIGLPVAASAKVKRVIATATVQANQAWQKVAIVPHGRGVLRFRTDGIWVFNPSQRAVDGDGAESLSTAGRINYTFGGTDGREGQLIGKIGRGKPFVAGAHGVHKVKRGETGPLYLSINDDIKQIAGNGLADNSGQLRVTVEYEVPRVRK